MTKFLEIPSDSICTFVRNSWSFEIISKVCVSEGNWCQLWREIWDWRVKRPCSIDVLRSRNGINQIDVMKNHRIISDEFYSCVLSSHVWHDKRFIEFQVILLMFSLSIVFLKLCRSERCNKKFISVTNESFNFRRFYLRWNYSWNCINQIDVVKSSFTHDK